MKARGPLRSFRTACPSFGGQALTVTFRLKQGARVRVDLLQGHEGRAQGADASARARRPAPTRCKIKPKGLKAGNYTLRLRATRAGRTTTLKLPVTRTR